jgi:hypothetical protein
VLPELAATLALLGAQDASGDPAYRFAHSLARAGPRPAAGRLERRAHERVAKRFRQAGLDVTVDPFRVPGLGRSRNVIGAYDTPRDCLFVIMAHADTVPPSPGAEDNASGVGTLVGLATGLSEPRCDVWFVATGAEERIHTGQPDHLGATALVRHIRRTRTGDLRWALSLDEVGRGRTMWLRSPRRRGLERRLDGDAHGLRVRWVADAGEGLSDHREFTLAGEVAAKLGVPDNPARHTAADVPSRLTPRTFVRVQALVRSLLERDSG